MHPKPLEYITFKEMGARQGAARQDGAGQFKVGHGGAEQSRAGQGGAEPGGAGQWKGRAVWVPEGSW